VPAAAGEREEVRWQPASAADHLPVETRSQQAGVVDLAAEQVVLESPQLEADGWCRHCGTALKTSDLFCMQCGLAVERENTQR
jgi:hypothetical protein